LGLATSTTASASATGELLESLMHSIYVSPGGLSIHTGETDLHGSGTAHLRGAHATGVFSAGISIRVVSLLMGVGNMALVFLADPLTMLALVIKNFSTKMNYKKLR